MWIVFGGQRACCSHRMASPIARGVNLRLRLDCSSLPCAISGPAEFDIARNARRSSAFTDQASETDTAASGAAGYDARAAIGIRCGTHGPTGSDTAGSRAKYRGAIELFSSCTCCAAKSNACSVVRWISGGRSGRLADGGKRDAGKRRPVAEQQPIGHGSTTARGASCFCAGKCARFCHSGF
jgi:hypothetical protein